MLRGLTASVILHAGVIASGLIVLPNAREPVDVIEVVPVDIVNISEVTNVASARARIADLPPPEELQSEQPEPDIEEFLDDLDVLPEDTPVLEDEVPPPPAPEKDDTPEDVVPEESDVKETEPEKPEPEPEKKDEVKRDALDDLLDDSFFETNETPLINKAPPKLAKRISTPPPVLPEPPEEERSQKARRGAGERTANEARIEALIWAQMEGCWETVADLPDPERLNVRVRINLDRDGRLEGGAELINPRRRPIGDRFMGQAIDRALRAARSCQPYSFPGDDYEIWNEITMNFRHDSQN